MLGYGGAGRRQRAGKPFQDPRNNGFYEDWSDSSSWHSFTPHASSPMKEQRRFEEEQHYRDYHSSHGNSYRDRSPPSNPHRKSQSGRRGRYSGGRRPSGFARGRGAFRESGRPYQEPPRSPRRFPEYPEPRRSDFNEDWDYRSGEPSPSDPRKRRRTRSPSPARWNRRLLPEPQSYSPSRDIERFEGREGGRTVTNRARSPHDPSSARLSRPASRGAVSDVDFNNSSRRHRDRSPPHPTHVSRRSQSPYRRNSPTPPPAAVVSSPPRRGRGIPTSPRRARHPSPHFAHAREHNRPYERDVGGGKKLPSRTPSVVGDWEEDSMDGPYPSRGNFGNPNHGMRGRGQRPYNNSRGNFRGSPPFSSANSSYHGSPHSDASYRGGRSGWDGSPQHGPSHGPNSPPYRQNNFAGAGQSQEEYFQSQMQSQGNHPHSTQSQRPFRGNRGGRGGYRGNYQQQGPPDRRFSGPDHQDSGPPTRGRGSHYNNLQWTASGSKRGGGPQHPATGPNSVQASPALSHKGSRASLEDNEDMEMSRPPRERENQTDERRDQPPNQKGFRNTPHKDNSKISFAFKSKQPPTGPAKPPADLNSKARGPPVAHDDRPPPTQPKAKFFEKKNQKAFERNERRDFDGPGRLPPPQAPHQHRPRHSPTEHRGRSRSPPPKRQKQESRPKPKLSPEMAASESIYFRKPGNESVIGAGTYGKVFKAIHIYTKDKVALKKIRMEGERDGFPITAVREIKLLQNLRHKHVVALQEVMVEKNECFMVFEYMSHDLTGLINHPTFKLTPAHKKDLGRQIFEGLEFLHRRGVMHRDIKAANLLISHDGQLKYADFGLARFYTKSRQLDYTNRVITIWYRPPELLLGETQYGPSVDIWSAACVFMEMFTKKAIFPGEGGELSQLEKVYAVLGTPTRTEWPGIADLPWYELMHLSDRRKRTFEASFENVLSPAALDLVKAIFNYDPQQRPNAEEILQHPYFTEEEPAPKQAYELADVNGDWHEYESKAHRRENERKEKERRKEEYIREREKRKAKDADLDPDSTGSDPKKFRPESSELEPGQGEPPPPPQDERAADDSDGEGSARMSMS